VPDRPTPRKRIAAFRSARPRRRIAYGVKMAREPLHHLDRLAGEKLFEQFEVRSWRVHDPRIGQGGCQGLYRAAPSPGAVSRIATRDYPPKTGQNGAKSVNRLIYRLFRILGSIHEQFHEHFEAAFKG
jgi:hypothetical protein